MAATPRAHHAANKKKRKRDNREARRHADEHQRLSRRRARGSAQSRFLQSSARSLIAMRTPLTRRLKSHILDDARLRAFQRRAAAIEARDRVGQKREQRAIAAPTVVVESHALELRPSERIVADGLESAARRIQVSQLVCNSRVLNARQTR